jgi:hypothetical protein
VKAAGRSRDARSAIDLSGFALLRLAQRYDWTPAGTNPPDPAVVESDGLGRDGSYFPPNCQIMTREDAQHFAQGLEQALVDIPDGTASSEALSANSGNALLGLVQHLRTVKPYLRDFIAHCRECGELWIC